MSRRKLRNSTWYVIVSIALSLLIPIKSAEAAAPWGSISFNGTQYLSSTNMSAPGTSDFTYEVWFYNTIESGSNQVIMNTRSNVSFPQLQDGFDLMIRPDRSIAASYRSYWLSESAANVIKTNQWYHFALVRVGTNIYGYLNGTQISGKPLDTGGRNFTSTVMQIGSTLNGGSKFNGNIANIRYVTSSIYTSDFSLPTDDFTNIANTSILMNTKNDASFITNSIGGTTFTNNGGAVASSMNPFDWLAEQKRLSAEAAAKAESQKRDSIIKAARDRLTNALLNNQPIDPKDFSDADLPVKSVDSLILAYRELIAYKASLQKPLASDEAEKVKRNRIMKYVMYERIMGINSGPIYERDLMQYGLMTSDAPMKELTIYQMMKSDSSLRDSIAKVNSFINESAARYVAQKARLTATMARNNSR